MLPQRGQNLKVISVSINGEVRQFDRPISVAALLEQMQLTGKRIALERNGEILRSEERRVGKECA